MTRCAHETFDAQANVFRLSAVEGGPINAYKIEVTVHCAVCGLKFRFLGLPFGSHPTQPTMSVDGLELRATLEPAHVPEILGQPITSGRA